MEVRRAGSRDYGVYPVNQMACWVTDPYSGEQRAITYAEVSASVPAIQGTSTADKDRHAIGFSDLADRKAGAWSSKAMNVYTVEALAAIDGR